jgi:hypothetical protein
LAMAVKMDRKGLGHLDPTHHFSVRHLHTARRGLASPPPAISTSPSGTQDFTATGDLSQAPSGATATLLPNGKILIAGGQDSGGTLLPSAELYDPGTGTFSKLPNFVQTGSMHSPRAQHTATLLSNGKVLLVGSSGETASAELFDPAFG